MFRRNLTNVRRANGRIRKSVVGELYSVSRFRLLRLFNSPLVGSI